MPDPYQQLFDAWCDLIDEMDDYFDDGGSLSRANAVADRLFERLVLPLQTKYGVELSRRASERALMGMPTTTKEDKA